MSEKFRAVFSRGGTSKALIFARSDLPPDRGGWDALFRRALGSPDPYGRQLDGMGGGLSSLSKVCVISPATRDDADVDYLFAQIQVSSEHVDYTGNCGNMSAAIGPYAVTEGIVTVPDGEASVRIHNVNTGKIIESIFEVRNGQPVEDGTYTMMGVAGTAAPIRLNFLDPGGAVTGKLLPSGHPTDLIDDVCASLVDAANPCVFLHAQSVGLAGNELPESLESDPALLDRLESIRQHASVAMGIAATVQDAAKRSLVPLIALVAEPSRYTSLSREVVEADEIDLCIRFFSNGRPHRAAPITGALCAAAARYVEGTTVHSAVDPTDRPLLRLGTPSGVLELDASVVRQHKQFTVRHASVLRTSRRLFEGYICI